MNEENTDTFDEKYHELIETSKKIDANKKAREGNFHRPPYDPNWRKRDYISELENKSIDDIVDELSGSKEDDNYLYGSRL